MSVWVSTLLRLTLFLTLSSRHYDTWYKAALSLELLMLTTSLYMKLYRISQHFLVSVVSSNLVTSFLSKVNNINNLFTDWIMVNAMTGAVIHRLIPAARLSGLQLIARTQHHLWHNQTIFQLLIQSTDASCRQHRLSISLIDSGKEQWLHYSYHQLFGHQL